MYRHSGEPDSGWVVLDYVDVVVHIFSPDMRTYYALERLWADATVVEEVEGGRTPNVER